MSSRSTRIIVTSSTTTASTTASTTTTANSTVVGGAVPTNVVAAPQAQAPSTGYSLGLVLTISISATLLVALLAFFVVYFIRRNRRRPDQMETLFYPPLHRDRGVIQSSDPAIMASMALSQQQGGQTTGYHALPAGYQPPPTSNALAYNESLKHVHVQNYRAPELPNVKLTQQEERVTDNPVAWRPPAMAERVSNGSTSSLHRPSSSSELMNYTAPQRTSTYSKYGSGERYRSSKLRE
jgi:hypothetical protein